ncbi:CobD/CbiB family cobalamin biosynthesis protein [Acidithrix ferrooxidans]|uniref:Cobalamin biosynthesis protein CobD n=1 Tax=Acidithrix ferrooxidans TaxID=1280514 RepID=A0A0D8HJH6_9ACTN|nr:CobD/CbiB family cobalamin biosynthesis protein [Acidithrix ferrooxidans]KJF18098.1 cobalamin biosynthesis protein CbiB [Acidithrix ferrooxidans]
MVFYARQKKKMAKGLRIRVGANSSVSRAMGIVGGYLLDSTIGELPSPIHPLVHYGRYANFAQEIFWSDTKAGGLRYLAALAAPIALFGLVPRGWKRETFATYLALGRRSLVQHVEEVLTHLEAGDIAPARRALSMVVGRDTAELTFEAIASALVETLAENFNDAVAATIFWEGVGGNRFSLLHRVANTADAMVGHLNKRYVNFGFVSAKTDDALGYLPARLGSLALILGGGGATLAQVIKIVRLSHSQSRAHPSPNAGLMEATLANMLDVALGGPITYDGVLSDRPKLGGSRGATPADVRRAIEVVDRASLWMVAIGVAIALSPGLKVTTNSNNSYDSGPLAADGSPC